MAGRPLPPISTICFISQARSGVALFSWDLRDPKDLMCFWATTLPISSRSGIRTRFLAHAILDSIQLTLRQKTSMLALYLREGMGPSHHYRFLPQERGKSGPRQGTVWHAYQKYWIYGFHVGVRRLPMVVKLISCGEARHRENWTMQPCGTTGEVSFHPTFGKGAFSNQ